MAKEGNLLIVDDNSSILGALRLLLERHFAKVTTLTSPKLLDTVLRGEAVDAVLLDMNFTAGVNNQRLFRCISAHFMNSFLI